MVYLKRTSMHVIFDSPSNDIFRFVDVVFKIISEMTIYLPVPIEGFVPFEVYILMPYISLLVQLE